LNDFYEEALNLKNILNECTKYRPKDCIHFDIQLSETKYYYFEEKTEEFTEEIRLIWDKNYPIISYIETLVMTFTDYLCYCGRLFGL
jgi:hypothetical protein